MRTAGLQTHAGRTFPIPTSVPPKPRSAPDCIGVLNDELKAHYERRLPNSYREWDDFNKIACPRLYRDVLKDDFPRVSKSRPPFVPKGPIVPKQEENGDGV